MARLGLPVPEDLPADDRIPGADDAMLARQMAGARCSFEELANAGQVQLPLEFPGHWVDAHFERIGGWRLAPAPLLEAWSKVRVADEQAAPIPALRFISRRQRRKLNASLSFLGSPADIILHPEDATAHGIVDGTPVRVSTSRGAITLTAKVDDGIRPGVASIPHGHETANVNLLTSVEDVDTMTGMVLYSGIPITITPEAVAA
jgi:anaerobic selenocysteine-containing dehydrogenase